jgi:polysaccharide export outer membrane protein
MKNAAVLIIASLTCLAPAVVNAQSTPPVQQPVGPVQQPVGTTGAARPTSTAATSPDYKLGTGDKLRVEVYKEPQLSQNLQIRPDGKITLPLLGDVVAAGVTPRDLTNTLTERFREFLNTPVVTVIVAEAVPPVVYVLGEVNTPGAQSLVGPTTVLQALALAGGFKDFANESKIRILRNRPDGTVQTINFNYKDAIKSTGKPAMVMPGDTIIVP